jgi:hypothetical protein
MDWVFQPVSGSEETLHASSITDSNDDTDHKQVDNEIDDDEIDDEQIDNEWPSIDNNLTNADNIPSSQYTNEERLAMESNDGAPTEDEPIVSAQDHPEGPAEKTEDPDDEHQDPDEEPCKEGEVCPAE